MIAVVTAGPDYVMTDADFIQLKAMLRLCGVTSLFADPPSPWSASVKAWADRREMPLMQWADHHAGDTPDRYSASEPGPRVPGERRTRLSGRRGGGGFGGAGAELRDSRLGKPEPRGSSCTHVTAPSRDRDARRVRSKDPSMIAVVSGGIDYVMTERDFHDLKVTMKLAGVRTIVTEPIGAFADCIRAWALRNDIPVMRGHPASAGETRDAYGRRNAGLAALADVVIAFPGGPATADLLGHATRHGKRILATPSRAESLGIGSRGTRTDRSSPRPSTGLGSAI
ncbi:MAG: hypothetical protein JWM32_1287 [Verrucomicrobia bacterium]|nr:hypothetical protein [Verrucomicrobiota bacterium]